MQSLTSLFTILVVPDPRNDAASNRPLVCILHHVHRLYSTIQYNIHEKQTELSAPHR